MKKILFVLAIASVMTFVACSNKTVEAEEEQLDTIVIEEVVTDTIETVADTVVIEEVDTVVVK